MDRARGGRSSFLRRFGGGAGGLCAGGTNIDHDNLGAEMFAELWITVGQPCQWLTMC